jgi:hypothetical protein
MTIEISYRANAREMVDSSHKDWNLLPWMVMEQVGIRQAAYETKAKLAYNKHGIASVVWCQDRVLTVQDREDFGDLYLDDVVEWFFWTDERYPVYIEYEMSPKNKELILFVSNTNGEFMGWQPWKYEKDRRISHQVVVEEGNTWIASCFIPFALLKGLSNSNPRAGTVWRGNIFRMDFDQTPEAKWALDPESGAQFHNYKQFAILRFGKQEAL